MLVRCKDAFFDLNRLVRAIPMNGAMHLTLASPGGNVFEIIEGVSPEEFEELIVAHTDMLGYGPLGENKHLFSTPADWANVGRADSEGSM